MIKKIFYIPLLLLTVALGTFALNSANVAQAASVYDDAVRTSENAEAGFPTTILHNMNVPWSEVFNSTSGSFVFLEDKTYTWTGDALTNYSDIKDVWDNKESWGVTQVIQPYGELQLHVWFTSNFADMAEFVNYGSYSGLLVNTSSTRSITISVNYYTGNIVVTTGDIAGSTAGIISENTDGSGIQFLSWFANVPINYPPGYEGSTPPDSEPTEEPIPDFSSIVSLNYYVNNKKLDWYNSTDWGDSDLSRVACEYYLTLFNEEDPYSPIQIDSFIGSCSDELRTYNLEEYGEYTLSMTVYYDTNNDSVYSELTGDDIVGEVSLLIKVDGQIFQGGGGSEWRDNTRFEPSSCIQETFPYINLVGCTQMFGKVFSILTFGVIDFANVYDLSGCVSLVTLGSWLGLPSSTVCPQVSETVRNIVTPFVTFGVVLAVITFISRQKGEDQG